MVKSFPVAAEGTNISYHVVQVCMPPKFCGFIYLLVEILTFKKGFAMAICTHGINGDDRTFHCRVQVARSLHTSLHTKMLCCWARLLALE